MEFFLKEKVAEIRAKLEKYCRQRPEMRDFKDKLDKECDEHYFFLLGYYNACRDMEERINDKNFFNVSGSLRNVLGDYKNA